MSALFCAALLGLAASRAAAIDITLVPDTAAGNFPSYDPDGSHLTLIANAAALMWEQRLPGPGTFSMNIHWLPYNNPSSSQLAYASLTENAIQFRTDIAGIGNGLWFLDSTPLVNEEFGSFTQDLYRDSTEQSWFPNGAPDLLEIGYYASGVSGDASAGFDLFSVALHEIGHFLVVASNEFSPAVPIPQEFIGNFPNVKVERGDNAHLGPQFALMDPGTPDGTRTLPSALDIIAAAGNYGWTDVDLVRADWLGDVAFPFAKQWAWDPGWTGGEEPNIFIDATIRGGVDLTISGAPAIARSLLLTEGSTLQINDDLGIGQDMEMRDNSIATLATNRLLHALGNLTLDGGFTRLQLAGGTAQIDGLVLNGSQIAGYGTLEVGGQLRNRGSINADGGTLQVFTPVGATLDLDGSGGDDGDGILFARDGNLDFQGVIADEFNGNAYVSAGHWIRFNSDWTFGSAGNLDFEDAGAAGEFANSNPASHLTFGAGSSVSAFSGSGRIAAGTITFQPDSDVFVNSGLTLTLEGSIEYFGGDFYGNGDGTLRQNGNATVTGKVSIGLAPFGIGTYDWDGNLATPSNTKLQPGAEFSIKADSLGGAYAGEVDIGDSATLNVEITSGFGLWELAPQGVIRFQGSGLAPSVLSGSPLTVRGTLEALDGRSRIENNLTLSSGSTVAIADSATLELAGIVAYGDGVSVSLSGALDASVLAQFGSASVTAYHTMHLGFFNWDPSDFTDSHTTIQPDATFDIRALRIGNYLFGVSARNGFGDTVDIQGGTLRVVVGGDHPVLGAFPDVWKLNETGVINLDPGGHAPARIEGSRLYNAGTISGTGEIDAPLENHGLLDIGHDGAAGMISVFDVYEQGADGALHIELGGYDAGLTYDQLRLMLTGELNGILGVNLLGGFAPNIGDTFRVVNSSGGISGAFATLNLPGLASGEWVVQYSGFSVDLLVIPEPSSALLVLAGLGTLLSARRGRRDCRWWTAGVTFSSARNVP